ncbi:MAG: acetylornithine/succinylornithine family transaminase [Candidatus Undinarchaeales archaeon]|jgi:acetylornithine/LysW-gamma-L-lysine aminotransferase|nr:acetylornithine/succinylornithine family transaminase [Candidatus Undinarchaeales archaeon]MDP7494351.1 acetylornithine/succinylornithine family transaminase [Candidatus Undinarchaeales archaeon]
MNVIAVEDACEVDVYPRRDVVLVRGQGSTLYDHRGRAYIDCAANVGVSNIGHGNERVARAIAEQYLTLGNCYGMFYNDVRARLAQKLVTITPPGLDRVFFCNSGTEAVEAAIKFARATTNRHEIVCAMRGFHGKTMGSLGATWGKHYQEPFLPMLAGFHHAPFNKFERLEAAISDDTAAILLEVVQGEGGVRVGDPDFFAKVRRCCDDRGILLLIDEVQTGFGRTGKMFAHEHYVVPDILCLAKAIAGGVPMGAVVCNERVRVPRKSHTTTFGGSPLACAAALASLEVIEQEGLVAQAADQGAYFLDRLRTIESDRIREVRGLGLMIGIELKGKAAPYVRALMDRGIIALLAGKCVIRLLPPLIITRDEIDRVLACLQEVFAC